MGARFITLRPEQTVHELKALRIDPALASDVFVTTVTDCAGFALLPGLGVLARLRGFGFSAPPARLRTAAAPSGRCRKFLLRRG